jgi:hypothetical protein
MLLRRRPSFYSIGAISSPRMVTAAFWIFGAVFAALAPLLLKFSCSISFASFLLLHSGGGGFLCFSWGLPAAILCLRLAEAQINRCCGRCIAAAASV